MRNAKPVELSVQYIIKVLVKTPLSIVSRFKFTHSCIFLWMKYFSQWKATFQSNMQVLMASKEN